MSDTIATTKPALASASSPPPPAVPTPIAGADSAAAAADERKAKDRARLNSAAKQAQDRVRREAARGQELAQLRARAEAAEAAAARAAALEAEAADPLTFLEKRGTSTQSIIERALKHGTPAAQMEAMAKQIEESKAETARVNKEMQERYAREQHTAAMAQAKQRLLAAFDEMKGEAKYIAKLPEAKLLDEYMRTWNMVQQHPEARQYNYSDADILKATNERLGIEMEAWLEQADDEQLEKTLTKRKSSAQVKAEAGTPAASGRPGEKPANVDKSPKTLTSSMSQSSSGSWKPDNWDKLSDKQQNKLLIERLRANGGKLD